MRMPPLQVAEMTNEQRRLYESMTAGVGAKYTSFQTHREDGALIGPWSAWLHDPAIGESLWGVTQALTREQRIPDAARQVAILVVGAHFQAAYELYAHICVARTKHGAGDRRITTLVAGERPDDLDDTEALAFDTAKALLRGGVLPEALYQRCVAVFGQLGTNELIYMVGHYCVVSFTLNGFAVPSPDMRG